MFKIILTCLLVLTANGRDIPTKQGTINQVGSSVDMLAEKDVNIASRSDAGNDQDRVNEIFGSENNEGSFVSNDDGKGTVDKNGPKEEVTPKGESTPVGVPSHPHNCLHQHRFHGRRPFHHHHHGVSQSDTPKLSLVSNAPAKTNGEWDALQNNFETQTGQNSEETREEIFPKDREGQSTPQGMPSHPNDCVHEHGGHYHHRHHHHGRPEFHHQGESVNTDNQNRLQKRQVEGQVDVDDSPLLKRDSTEIDDGTSTSFVGKERQHQPDTPDQDRTHKHRHSHRGHHHRRPCNPLDTTDQQDKPTTADNKEAESLESRPQIDVRTGEGDECDHQSKNHEHHHKGRDHHDGGRDHGHHRGKHEHHHGNQDGFNKQTPTEHTPDLDETKIS